MSTPSVNNADTVLVLGATGNIGIAAIIGALRSGLKVVAAVRNQNSARKLLQHVPEGHDRITTVEADVTSENGAQDIVDQVRAGKLPKFQHVYATVGGEYTDIPILEISTEKLRHDMRVNFESNFFAYRATIPYLLEQKERQTTFTICTGAQGDAGDRAWPAMTQGALYSMCNAASKALAGTNVRFNEVYLALRVEVDVEAEQHGVTKSSEFARVYEHVLARSDIRSSRVRVTNREEFETLRVEQKGS